MKSRSGFTLIELMIVVIVIAIIAGIVAVAYNDQQNIARDNSAKSNLLLISQALDNYYDKNGTYPLTCISQTLKCTEEDLASPEIEDIPIIPASITGSELTNLLGVSSPITHPAAKSDQFINREPANVTRIYPEAGGTTSPTSYYLFTNDGITHGSVGRGFSHRFYYPNMNLHLECYMKLESSNPMRYRAYPYVLGFYSLVEEEWKLYRSPNRSDQNTIIWNTGGSGGNEGDGPEGCDAQDISALKL